MMKKSIVIVALLLLLSLCLPSCSSVYDDPSVITTEPLIEVDEAKECFTTGYLYTKTQMEGSFVYGDSWIYVESCPYKTVYEGDNGVNYNVDEIQRIVKMNAKTGVVSSACLDPVCNHSPGSDCLMLLPLDGTMLNLQRLIGDWIVFSHVRVIDGATVNETYIYNLKTGEVVTPFETQSDGLKLTKWSSIFDVGNTIYRVKNYLDYSKTGYDPNGQKPMALYKPETKSWLYSYDLDTGKSEELFEIPANYTVTAVSNMRYFFTSREEGSIYSCDYEGNNFKKEEVLDFSPVYLCGPYAYSFAEEGLKIYDVASDSMKTVPIEFASYAGYVTEAGALICSFTTCDEWMALDEKTFADAHPEIPLMEQTLAWSEELNKIMYKGSAQIWSIDLEGKEKKLFFEKEHCFIRIQHASGDYVFAIITYGDPQNDFAMLPEENDGRSVINLKTGEITAIPYLEVVKTE